MDGREPPSVRSTTSAARKAIAKAADASNARALIPRGEALGRSIYKQTVLHEDDYVEALGRIIARDFFPDVALAQQLAEHAQAEEEAQATPWRRSERTLNSTQRDLTATPFASAYGATPMSSEMPTAGPSRRPAKMPESFAKRIANQSKSLDAFINRYTSEDNSSFATILQEETVQRRVKNAWAFEASDRATIEYSAASERRERLVGAIKRAVESSENGSVMLIEGAEAGRPGERLILEDGRTSIAGDRQSIQDAKRRVIADAPREGQDLIEGERQRLLIEDGKQREEREIVPPDTGEAAARAMLKGKAKAVEPDEASGPPISRENGGVDAWKHTARNAFMFGADANVPMTERSQALPTDLSLNENDKLKAGDPATILHRNTRLPETIDPLALRGDDVPPSPSHSNIAAAISGTPCP